MRELVFKNLHSLKARKREVSVIETVNRGAFTSTTMKRSLYFVRNISHITSQKDFDKWMQEKNTNPSLNAKSFHVLKQHSDKDGVDKIFCKAKGTFYAIMGKDIYCIVFIHTIRMEIELTNRDKVG